MCFILFFIFFNFLIEKIIKQAVVDMNLLYIV